MKDKVAIVPVKIDPAATVNKSERSPVKPVCIVQSKSLKVSFYYGVKPYVIETVMKELNQYDS